MTDPIAEVVPSGIKLKTGEIVEMDVLVCATGYDYSWIPRFPIIGLNGIDLRSQWSERPSSYMGIAVKTVPNYFSKNFQTWGPVEAKDQSSLSGA